MKASELLYELIREALPGSRHPPVNIGHKGWSTRFPRSILDHAQAAGARRGWRRRLAVLRGVRMLAHRDTGSGLVSGIA